MEPSQFDELTKALATSTSRRQALKTFIASTFGGILALSGLGKAFAKGCDPACSGGLTCCGGECVDTKTDPNNCGVCGTVCRSGLCVNGLCCPPGAVKCGNSCCSFTCCGGTTCVNTQSDKKNCGSCGHACRSDQVCQNGTCVCPSGTTDCNGMCVNTKTDPNNCGACNNSCNGTTPGQCVNGSCVCFGLEHPCTSPSQCCDTGQGVTTCGSGGICCNGMGGVCIDDPDCCGSLHCTLGFCE